MFVCHVRKQKIYEFINQQAFIDTAIVWYANEEQLLNLPLFLSSNILVCFRATTRLFKIFSRFSKCFQVFSDFLPGF